MALYIPAAWTMVNNKGSQAEGNRSLSSIMRLPRGGTTKSERANSLARTRPLYSDFQRSGSGSRSQRLLPRNHSVPTNLRPHLPHSSMITLAARAFLPPSVPVARIESLDDSQRRLLVRSLLWKITLPLKEILLSSNGNTSGSDHFLLWK
jgi:hypothetical protein